MATENEIQTDKYGLQWRTQSGEEQHAIWVPISAAEKDGLIDKAKKENVDVRHLIASFLREWMAPKELSVADLDRVVGGATISTQTSSYLQLSTLSPTLSTQASKLPNLGQTASTVMCAW